MSVRFIKALTKVVRDTRISREARFLYVILKAYADKDGHCFPSADTLAKDIGTGRRQVFRWLKELVKWRVITKLPRIQDGKQSSNLYCIEDAHFVKHLSPKKGKKVVTERTHQGGDSADTRSRAIEVEHG